MCGEIARGGTDGLYAGTEISPDTFIRGIRGKKKEELDILMKDYLREVKVYFFFIFVLLTGEIVDLWILSGSSLAGYNLHL